MGNDGGSIPKRRELVKEAARNPSAAALKESQQEQQEYLWKTDPISQKLLSKPIVSDCTGKLYNKDTILEFLVSGTYAEEAERITRSAPIKSLKDVVEVHLEEANGDDGDGTSAVKAWKCPITGDRLGPPSASTGGVAGKAVYLVPCGHVFSASAVKEVAEEKCVVCETVYAANDVIPIVPISEADVARLLLRAKTLKEKGLTHSLKKAPGSGSKKRKKREAEAEGAEGLNSGVEAVQDSEKQNSTAAHDKSKVNGNDLSAASGHGINNSSTASLTAKVLQEGEAAKKRRRENENVRSLFSNKDQSNLLGNNADFMTRGFSVPGTTKR